MEAHGSKPPKRDHSVQYTRSESRKGYMVCDEARAGEQQDGDLFDRIVHGDAVNVLARYPAACIDLIFTSPPYADSRKKTYGGIAPDSYVQWFLPFADQFMRVLKPSGSFVLNIKEKTVDGERHTYVIELILALRKHGWLWTEEYIWHKKNCYPGRWPNRFPNAWDLGVLRSQSAALCFRTGWCHLCPEEQRHSQGCWNRTPDSAPWDKRNST